MRNYLVAKDISMFVQGFMFVYIVGILCYCIGIGIWEIVDYENIIYISRVECQQYTQQSSNQPNSRKCRSDQFPRPNNYQKNHQPRYRHFPKTHDNQHYNQLPFQPPTRT